jgi:hypothetical protein
VQNTRVPQEQAAAPNHFAIRVRFKPNGLVVSGLSSLHINQCRFQIVRSLKQKEPVMSANEVPPNAGANRTPVPARPKIRPWSNDPDLRFKFWQLLALYCNLLVAVFGIGFVVLTLRNNGQSVRNSVQQSMVKLVTDMDKVFVDKPELYPYFYECKEIDSSSPQYLVVSAASIQMLDLLDIADTQSSTFRDQWDTPEAWDNWIADQLLRSPITRATLRRHHTWYGTRLNASLDKVEAALKEKLAKHENPCG